MKNKPKKQIIKTAELLQKIAALQTRIERLESKQPTCPYPHYPPNPVQYPGQQPTWQGNWPNNNPLVTFF